LMNQFIRKSGGPVYSVVRHANARLIQWGGVRVKGWVNPRIKNL